MEKSLHERRLDFLRKEIEKKFCTVEGIKGCKELSRRMKDHAKDSDRLYNDQYLSGSTIMRLWGFTESKQKYSLGRRIDSWTLIARFLDYAGWDDFCERFNFVDNSPCIKLNPFNYLIPDELLEGTSIEKLITIGFPPLKYSILKKLDDGEFEVVEEKNMSNRKGTILYIESIILEPDTQNEDAFPEIKYIYLPNYQDEDPITGELKDKSLEYPQLL